MLRHLTPALLVAAMVALTMTNQSHAQITTWQIDAGAVFLNRDGGSGMPYVVDNAHSLVVDSAQMETSFHSGFNVQANRALGENYSINIRHFNVDDWTETDGSPTSNGAWLYETTTLGASAIDNVNSIFSADLYSTEINLVHHFRDRVSLMFGFRWLSISENLYQDFFSGGSPYSEYRGGVENNLYGFQAGADVVLFDNNGPFSLNSIFKGGVYGNDCSNDLYYANRAIGQSADEAMDAAFVGEIGILGTLFICDQLSLSAGYQLLWVEGVAKQSEQLGAVSWTTSNGISNDTGLFYHGAVVNLTGVF